MDQTQLKDFVDHQRWLIDNGLFTDLAKDNLYLYGSLVHKDICALHVVIDTEKKVIHYKLYATSSLISKVNRFDRLTKSDSLIDMWLLKRMLKKEGNLRFQPILNKFVSDFCGPKWRAEVTLAHIDTYVDNLDEQRTAESEGSNRQSD